MVAIHLPEAVVERLERKAEREQRQVSDLIVEWLDKDMPETEPSSQVVQRRNRADTLNTLFGLFDDPVTDLSMTVRETLEAYFKTKP
jgi:hypothetical protein